MRFKKEYYDFFKEAEEKEYKSTCEVAEDILKYFDNIIYAYYAEDTEDDNYWFLVNITDMFLQKYKFSIENEGMLNKKFLSNMITRIKNGILEEYDTEEDKEIEGVKESLMFINKLLESLNKL
jgi:hypothetical protein